MTTIKCRDIAFTNIQAVLFDKNGTLEDSEVYLTTLGQQAAKLIDREIPGIGESLLMAWGINNNGQYLDPAGLMAVASRRETEIATAAYIAATGKGWIESLNLACQLLAIAEQKVIQTPSPLFPGSRELLQTLLAADVKLGILSAATTEDVKNFVTAHNLGDYLQLQMGVDQGPSKPDPILFLQACETLGVEPSATLMIGDSVADMQMARNAQAAGCIGITWINQPENVQGADVVIHQFSEIQVFND